MKKYILSEIKKVKNSSISKISFFIPILASLIAIGFNYLGGEAAMKYNVETIVNHWALIWLPFQITLLSGMLNDFEEKNTQYKTIFSLNINLYKKETSRVSLVILLVLLSTFVLTLITLIAHLLFPISPVSRSLHSCITALFILLIMNSWQIPLWLWISRKMNMYFCLIVNALLSLELGSRFATNHYWLSVPWSWGLKAQTYFTDIYPNGLPITDHSNGAASLNDLLLMGVFGVLLFSILTYFDALSFRKMEVK